MNYRLFLMEPKRVYPHLVAKGATPEWVVAEWQPNAGDAGMWCEIERRYFTLTFALADIEMYVKRFPEKTEKKEQQ